MFFYWVFFFNFSNAGIIVLKFKFLEMRKADRDRDMVLPPSTVDQLIHKYKLPLTPCLPFIHKKFRDKRFIGSTNYEQVMRFLEETRRERHKIGPEEGGIYQLKILYCTKFLPNNAK